MLNYKDVDIIQGSPMFDNWVKAFQYAVPVRSSKVVIQPINHYYKTEPERYWMILDSYGICTMIYHLFLQFSSSDAFFDTRVDDVHCDIYLIDNDNYEFTPEGEIIVECPCHHYQGRKFTYFYDHIFTAN